jgi:hypothetical protein
MRLEYNIPRGGKMRNSGRILAKIRQKTHEYLSFRGKKGCAKDDTIQRSVKTAEINRLWSGFALLELRKEGSNENQRTDRKIPVGAAYGRHGISHDPRCGVCGESRHHGTLG